MAAYVANRTGVLSFANMALAILFSTRNNPLMYLSGWSQTTFLACHRWAARVAIVQAVVHSIVYTADYCYYQDDGNAYSAEAAQPYFWWGIIATIAMSLMAGLSVLPLRSYSYELFLVLHILLAVLSLVGCWYHVDIRFSKDWGYEVWLYIAFAFWTWDRLVRLLKVAYHNFPGRSLTRAELIPGTNIIMLTIFPGRGWTPQPGQHTFVYFPSLKRFWENHPFTILDWGYASALQPDDSESRSNSDSQTPNALALEKHEPEHPVKFSEQRSESSVDNTGEEQFYVRCLFRAHKGTTGTLHQTLLNSQPAISTISTLTEGPYGGLHPPTRAILQHADKVICIAGGIGITFAAGFAKQFARERSRSTLSTKQIRHGALFPQCKQFLLAWTVREVELLGHVRDRMLPELDDGGLDDGSMKYKFWLTGGGGDTATRSGPSAPAATDEYTTISSEKNAQATAHADRLVTMQSGHRMNVGDVIAVESTVGLDVRIAVLVCGPGSLSDEVRYQVACRARQGVLVDLIEETFSW